MNAVGRIGPHRKRREEATTHLSPPSSIPTWPAFAISFGHLSPLAIPQIHIYVTSVSTFFHLLKVEKITFSSFDRLQKKKSILYDILAYRYIA
jgi:hypothetical protein